MRKGNAMKKVVVAFALAAALSSSLAHAECFYEGELYEEGAWLPGEGLVCRNGHWVWGDDYPGDIDPYPPYVPGMPRGDDGTFPTDLGEPILL